MPQNTFGGTEKAPREKALDTPVDNLKVNCYSGHTFAEKTLLKIAYAYQQATKWHKRRPVIKLDE